MIEYGDVLLQIPTPTPQPPRENYIEALEGVSLWNSTDEAIHVWSWIGFAGFILQGVILLFIVYMCIRTVYRFFSKLAESDAQE